MTLARRYFLKLLGLAPLALVAKPPPVTFGLMWLEPTAAPVTFDQPADWGKVVGGVLLDDSVDGNEIARFDFDAVTEAMQELQGRFSVDLDQLEARLHP